ncbi:O-acetyl-transferase [Candidatus Protofrankia californiensis]|uniref:O-acetyl-transferase n=1 Tax=Candidatus Protofrankia californiensis TaxID=1839754 RepID=A0A1C3NXP2_9ACTN|nr:O-acetyl-transferase [Candidatus Protofrankia californiensis]
MPRRHERATIATTFDPRNNSLSFIRLTLAWIIVVYHAWTLGGFGQLRVGRFNPGELTVDSFFVISGFLITYSWTRTGTTRRFLWHRFLRILPGFWVCLIITAGIFAPLTWVHDNGSLDGYLQAGPHGPIQYVLANSMLRIRITDIAGTPHGVPFPEPSSGLRLAWNGSLWTLWWDVLCYLGLSALGLLGILKRRRHLVVLAAGGVWSALVVHWIDPDFAGRELGSQLAIGITRFVLLFLLGSLLFLYRERIILSWFLAALSVLAIASSLLISEMRIIFSLPLAYLIIWLGLRLPFRKTGNTNDITYGLYIYSFPFQQLMAVYGVHHHGVAPYYAACLSGTFILATTSWLLIERPVQQLKSWTPRKSARHPSGSSVPAVPSPRRSTNEDTYPTQHADAFTYPPNVSYEEPQTMPAKRKNSADEPEQ